MPRVYSVDPGQFTFTARSDVMALVPANEKPITLIGLILVVTSEIGEAQEEWLTVNIMSIDAPSGGTGSVDGVPTPRPMDEFDAAAGFTSSVRVDGVLTGGTQFSRHSDAMNVRERYERWWPYRISPHKTAEPGDILTVRLGTPADAILLDFTIYVVEGDF